MAQRSCPTVLPSDFLPVLLVSRVATLEAIAALHFAGAWCGLLALTIDELRFACALVDDCQRLRLRQTEFVDTAPDCGRLECIGIRILAATQHQLAHDRLLVRRLGARILVEQRLIGLLRLVIEVRGKYLLSSQSDTLLGNLLSVIDLSPIFRGRDEVLVGPDTHLTEIGRESCRERSCQYG